MIKDKTDVVRMNIQRCFDVLARTFSRHLNTTFHHEEKVLDNMELPKADMMPNY